MSEARGEDEDMRIGEPETAAVGVPGVVASMRYALSEMGPARSLRTLLRVNQAEGFDCPSCAWGDPAVNERSHAEFCENGAKAVAWEATRKRVDAAFFAAHPVSFLREQTDHWLESNGRLTEPMYLAAGADPLHADRLGRGVPAGRRPAQGAAGPEPGRVLHQRPGLQRGGVRLPAARPQARHQQPARLLQHVPRVERGRPVADDRDRQGPGHPGGHLRAGRADRGGRAEPGHQPPPDAVRPRGGQAPRREDRRGQPAARGRPDAVQEPAEGPRPRATAPSWPTGSCRSGSTATWPCSPG